MGIRVSTIARQWDGCRLSLAPHDVSRSIPDVESDGRLCADHSAPPREREEAINHRPRPSSMVAHVEDELRKQRW